MTDPGWLSERQQHVWRRWLAAQAMLPALGRSCTSDDWIANSAGALIGGALAAGALAVARRRGAARPGRGTA